MAPLLGNLLAIMLSALGLLHLMWAVGISFPFANEQALARSIVGRRGITRLPSRSSVGLLAALLFAASGLAFIMGQHYEFPRMGKALMVPFGLFLGGVFILRGIVGVLPAFERAAPEQPYLSLNRRLYSPLCALIGLGFLLLTFTLPNWTWRLSQLMG